MWCHLNRSDNIIVLYVVRICICRLIGRDIGVTCAKLEKLTACEFFMNIYNIYNNLELEVFFTMRKEVGTLVCDIQHPLCLLQTGFACLNFIHYCTVESE